MTESFTYEPLFCDIILYLNFPFPCSDVEEIGCALIDQLCWKNKLD